MPFVVYRGRLRIAFAVRTATTVILRYMYMCARVCCVCVCAHACAEYVRFIPRVSCARKKLERERTLYDPLTK